jgi:hypothetical protein
MTRMVVPALLALGLMVVLSGAPPAHANDGERDTLTEADAQRTYHTSTQTLSNQATGTVCSLRVSNPHNSGHATSPRINQTSFIRCTDDVYYLRVTTELQRWKCIWFVCWWGKDARAGEDYDYNDDFVRAHSNRTCKEGNYRGMAIQVVQFQSNSWPEVRIGYSYERELTCP